MKLEEVNLKTKEAVNYLVQSLEAGQSSILTQYLGAMAKFRNYSFGNIMLIARQKPDATNVAGLRTWNSLGNSQVLIPVRELAAWIESNILLQLASAPFDKQDETLVPAAGSCCDCRKRTGYNKLLFADVRKDSCTDPQCFRAKIDAHVSKALETKPQLVQISSAWSTREGAPLGKNRYVELEIKKAKTNGTGSKVAAYQKPCQKMTEGVVMDGGRRGELVKVCADPSCRVHHPDTPSPEQVAKERAEERKRIEKSKQAITIRHCVLAKVLERVAAPLKKADLLTVAQYTIGHLSYNQVPVLAKRQKVDTAKTTKPPQEVLMKKISTYDEAALSRLLLEISLLDSAYQRGDVSQDLLMDAAKRFRVDVEKVEKSVAAEFAAKRSKPPKAKTKPKPKSAA